MAQYSACLAFCAAQAAAQFAIELAIACNEWLRAHPEAVQGTIVFILGVAFVVSVGPGGLPVLLAL